MIAICAPNSGMNAFQMRERSVTPAAAYQTANDPESTRDIPNRKVGIRPMATTSLAIPMATNVKKTASRKMTTALRGAFRNGFEEFIDS